MTETAIASTPTASSGLSVKDIEALIPHRWPFLLVDRIVEYEPDAKRIVGIKAVTATEWFFQGHFPGLPVMPGVLQVEALAQTMAVYVARQPGFGDRIGLFAGIDEVRFKRVVVPGDTLRLERDRVAMDVGERGETGHASTSRAPRTCAAQGGAEHVSERTSRCVSERAQATTRRCAVIGARQRAG